MTDLQLRNVLVANPGHLPWMPRVAERLHELALLTAYIAPVATTPAQIDRVRRRVPGAIGQRIAAELGRRQVPAGLADAQLAHAALPLEVLSVLAKRARAPIGSIKRLADARDAAFDRSVARMLTARSEAVLVAYAAAERTLGRARELGLRTFLEYPVGHHDFDASLLQEEQRRVPEYAPTMQFHRTSPARGRRLGLELDRTDFVVALSEFHRRTFVDAGVPAEKVVQGPMFGVDTTLFRLKEAEERPTFRVIFVGQVTQRKGISYVVDAFRHAAIPKSELLIVGRAYVTDAPWRSTPGLRHIDMVAPWETPELYRSADVFVLPALSDACPRAVLEAMAAGLPVIVSENTGTADAVDDGVSGYIVPIRDEDAIAERLQALHQDPDLRGRMGRAARERATEMTWDRYAAGVARLVTAA